MADSDYRRLGCAVEECAGVHKAHGYCLRHYRQWQRGGVRQDATRCANCAGEFHPPHVGAIYCSNRCKQAAWKKANPERHRALPSNQPKLCAVYAGYCDTCGGAFVSRRERKYCTPACEPRHDNREFRLGIDYIPPVRTCCCCGLQWSAIRRIGRSQYCQTPECQQARAAKAREMRKRSKRGKSHVQRAKRHGRRYGYFNVLRVFERDRWTCQLCGVKTPKALRGTCDQRAPEVDHIVPIAAGGDHVMENLQCACRRCNGEKQARPAGQLWLLGFADTKVN